MLTLLRCQHKTKYAHALTLIELCQWRHRGTGTPTVRYPARTETNATCHAFKTCYCQRPEANATARLTKHCDDMLLEASDATRGAGLGVELDDGLESLGLVDGLGDEFASLAVRLGAGVESLGLVDGLGDGLGSLAVGLGDEGLGDGLEPESKAVL